jgi:hypothetical protein
MSTLARQLGLAKGQVQGSKTARGLSKFRDPHPRSTHRRCKSGFAEVRVEVRGGRLEPLRWPEERGGRRSDGAKYTLNDDVAQKQKQIFVVISAKWAH